jgi:hypothetical protein
MAKKNEYDWVYKTFEIDPLPGKILYARYDYEDDYSGYAVVLYLDPDGELWENEGSHCSCNGLEGQWSPGLVTAEYVLKRGTETEPSGYSFKAEDCEAYVRIGKALIRKAKRDAKKLEAK